MRNLFEGFTTWLDNFLHFVPEFKPTWRVPKAAEDAAGNNADELERLNPALVSGVIQAGGGAKVQHSTYESEADRRFWEGVFTPDDRL